jgi:hypothetical protein
MSVSARIMTENGADPKPGNNEVLYNWSNTIPKAKVGLRPGLGEGLAVENYTDPVIGPFETVVPVSGRYQAECRKCGKSVWVGNSGVVPFQNL